MMELLSNWKDEAVCASDTNSPKWVSYNLDDIEYAKKGCAKCNVRKECLIMAFKNDSFIGVVAGISEYDYLLHSWKKVTEEDESNWRTDDSIFPRLLQKIQ
jgi:hypothetical protein